MAGVRTFGKAGGGWRWARRAGTPPALRRLGIDPGTRRVGVAVADEDGMLASARTTIEHVSDVATARAIAKLADEEEAGEIVVGLPLGLDGKENPSSRRARALAQAIAAESGKKVVLWDERLTSQAAHRALAAGGASSRDRRGRVDAIAAVLLLESYLDAVRAKAARAQARARAARTESEPGPDAGAGTEEPWPRSEPDQGGRRGGRRRDRGGPSRG